MAPQHVLKIPQNNDDGSFVLLHVASRGSKPLDVGLAATEGSGRYVASLKHDRVASLRVKNCPADEIEWQTILDFVLKQQAPPDIHATAVVQEDSSISITIRKQIQGITQRLGSISLNYDMSEDIQLFDWCAVAAEASTESKAAASSAVSKAADLESIVNELKSQLDDLVQAKQEDETALLQKFQDLLNEKKVKIRELQKVIASGSFDENQAAASQPPQTAKSQTSRAAGQSRSSKRKASSKPTRDSDEDEDDDLQKMKVDNIKAEDEDTDPGNTTAATASTASDDDDDEGIKDAAGPPESEDKSNNQSTKRSTARPPPRRDLPFANRKPAQPAAAKAPSGAGDETESDDEL